ncbi:DUF333 domain-containing protein [Neisseria subflava]|uniref:DUF333 domain-containing protein n=1 Tax=Neisseria subflava TaxID=28449 RepID=UPI0027E0DA20|nr:DUF333 domain-containing protein [Neisseria subflava]
MAKPKASTIGSAYPSSRSCPKRNGKLEMTRDRNTIDLRYLPNGQTFEEWEYSHQHNK